MGFRIRKFINLGGGFKINLSKSGIGYSWGIPGYRITKTAKGTTRRTYSIPGTGISYVDETGKNTKNTRSTQPTEANTLPQNSIQNFEKVEINNITSAIERVILLNKLSNILIICGIFAIAHQLLLILSAFGIILKIIAHKFGPVELAYTLDSEKTDEYNRRIGAWQILAEGDKEWQVIHESNVLNTKTNAGAGRNVNRIVCEIEKITPFYIKTNVDTIQLKLHNEVMIFLPDKVFIIKNGKVGLINYEDISISTSQVRFVESDRVPKDALIVDTTWQYVNKNGAPDKRFKNNLQLPICQYGVVYLTSSSGLNVEMQFSNINKVRDFKELIE
jgi:hypothetical protein